jgi:hypothetical protein
VEYKGSAGPVCVTTRLRLRGVRSVVKFLVSYRRVGRSLCGVSGLMHASLLWEGPFTVYIFSVWQSESLMSRWVGVDSHVDAVRSAYRDVAGEAWSGLWRLDFVSPSARRWSSSPAMEAVSVADEMRVPEWG